MVRGSPWRTWVGVVDFFIHTSSRTLGVQINNRLPATTIKMTTTNSLSYLAGMNLPTTQTMIWSSSRTVMSSGWTMFQRHATSIHTRYWRLFRNWTMKFRVMETTRLVISMIIGRLKSWMISTEAPTSIGFIRLQLVWGSSMKLWGAICVRRMLFFRSGDSSKSKLVVIKRIIQKIRTRTGMWKVIGMIDVCASMTC